MVLTRAEYRRLKGSLLPESPDFESIARASLHLTSGAYGEAGSHITVDDLAEQLRQVWNARGAADMAKVTTECPDFDVEPNRAIVSLDR